MGQHETSALITLITGNWGLFIALMLTLFGLYQILVARNTSLGVIMVAVGLMLPFTVNIMNGLMDAFCPTITLLGGSCTGTGPGTGGGQWPI